MTKSVLFNLACPKCGSDEHLTVAIETWAELSADRSKPIGDHVWNESSGCSCTSCGFKAVVENFRVAPDALPPPLKTFHVSFWEYDKYFAEIEAIDAAHAQTLAEAMLERGGPDSFDIITNTREDLDIEEVAS